MSRDPEFPLPREVLEEGFVWDKAFSEDSSGEEGVIWFKPGSTRMKKETTLEKYFMRTRRSQEVFLGGLREAENGSRTEFSLDGSLRVSDISSREVLQELDKSYTSVVDLLDNGHAEGVLWDDDLDTQRFEYFVVQCPKELNVNLLSKQTINLSGDSSLKLEGRSMKYEVLSIKEDPVGNINLVLPNKETKEFKLVSVPVSGRLLIADDGPEIDIIPKDENNSFKKPERVKMPESLTEKHPFLTKEKDKNWRKSEHGCILESVRVPRLERESISESSLIVDLTSKSTDEYLGKKKKKKKSKHRDNSTEQRNVTDKGMELSQFSEVSIISSGEMEASVFEMERKMKKKKKQKQEAEEEICLDSTYSEECFAGICDQRRELELRKKKKKNKSLKDLESTIEISFKGSFLNEEVGEEVRNSKKKKRKHSAGDLESIGEMEEVSRKKKKKKASMESLGDKCSIEEY